MNKIKELVTKAMGMSMKAKVIAGVVTLAVVGGITTGAVVYSNNNNGKSYIQFDEQGNPILSDEEKSIMEKEKADAEARLEAEKDVIEVVIDTDEEDITEPTPEAPSTGDSGNGVGPSTGSQNKPSTPAPKPETPAPAPKPETPAPKPEPPKPTRPSGWDSAASSAAFNNINSAGFTQTGKPSFVSKANAICEDLVNGRISKSSAESKIREMGLTERFVNGDFERYHEFRNMSYYKYEVSNIKDANPTEIYVEGYSFVKAYYNSETGKYTVHHVHGNLKIGYTEDL